MADRKLPLRRERTSSRGSDHRPDAGQNEPDVVASAGNAASPTRNADVTWPVAVELKPFRRKTLLSLRIDHDVLEWFKSQGVGYQTRMNAVLRAYAVTARAEAEKRQKATPP